MEIKKVGTLKSDVVVDIDKNDVLNFLHKELGVPTIRKAYDDFDPGFEESIILKKMDDGTPFAIYKKIDHYRNAGRGEGKFDYSSESFITTDKEKVLLYEAYLRIKNALETNAKIIE